MIEEEVSKQLELCMGCGYCRDAYGDDGWLDGLKTKHICPVKEVMGFDSYTAKGRILLGQALNEDLISYSPKVIDIFYKCTLCGNCEAHCISRGLPFIDSDIKVCEIIKYFRELIVNESHGIPEKIRKLPLTISEHGNVFGDEAPISSTPYLKENNDSETIYFLGCMVKFRESGISKEVDKLAKRLNLNIGVLENELCCGNILLRTGQAERAKSIMTKNAEILNNAGFKTLITSCPGCYSAFKNEYSKYGFDLNFDVQHITEYFIQNPQIKDLISNSKSLKITYHDPCELGRLNKIYDPPRQLLLSIPNIQLIEPFRTKINAWCCGSGAGVRAGYEDLSRQISEDRYSELKKTQADFIITACPNCLNSLGRIGETYDIIEFLNKFIN